MWVRFLAGRCARITWPFCCHSSQRIVVSQSLSFPPAAIVAGLPRLCRLQKPIWKINKGFLTPVHLVAFRQIFHRSQGAVCTNHIHLFFSSAVPRGVRGQEHNRLPSQPDCLRYLLSNNKGYSRWWGSQRIRGNTSLELYNRTIIVREPWKNWFIQQIINTKFPWNKEMYVFKLLLKCVSAYY